MIPEKGDTFINIPVTFDKQSKGRILTKQKFAWSALIFGGVLFACILCWIAGPTIWKFLLPLLGFTAWAYITRFILLRETYFKKKRNELRKNDYLFGTSTFWNITSIDEMYPYFVRFGSGLLGLFVVFDKDVIVGKPEDDEYYHYEAIASAYQEMCKRNISCMHVDYMDICGKDDRMQELFKLAANTENEDLKIALTRFFDNIEYIMNRAYACYDVYCFFSNSREDLFWDDVQGVIGILNQANFIRSRLLDREELGNLAKSLFNIDDFSVSQACDYIYKEQATNFLKPIWTERDGKRTIINKTAEEMAEAKRVMKEEKELRKIKQKKKKLKKGEVLPDDSISLWDEPTVSLQKEEAREQVNVNLQKKGNQQDIPKTKKELKQEAKLAKQKAKQDKQKAKQEAKLSKQSAKKQNSNVVQQNNTSFIQQESTPARKPKVTIKSRGVEQTDVNKTSVDDEDSLDLFS